MDRHTKSVFSENSSCQMAESPEKTKQAAAFAEVLKNDFDDFEIKSICAESPELKKLLSVSLPLVAASRFCRSIVVARP
jgi:hypothetical protein